MDIRDTVSRVLLGIAFGFVMGIVMYQAAGMDAGVTDKSVLRAQVTISWTSSPVGALLSSLGELPHYWYVACLDDLPEKAGTCIQVLGVPPPGNLKTFATLGDCEKERLTYCINSSHSVGCSAPNISCGSQGLCCNSTTHYCQISPEVKCMPKSASSISATYSSNGLCCNTAASTPFCQPI